VTLGGFISRNCEFDELTHFTEKQYRAIRARIRSSTPGLPRYSRATSNPGGEGHDWVFKRFGPWLDPDYEIPGREKRVDASGRKLPPAIPGEVLWFVSGERGEDVWVAKGTRDVEGTEAKSRCFIPARLSDNPRLVENDPGYVAALRDLDPVRRAQLKDGDWLVKPAKGLYFKRAHYTDRFVDVPPAVVRDRVRYWDRAATVDGDWTVGAKLSLTEEGLIFIEDIVRFRGEPGVVEANIKTTAELDGLAVLQCLEQDPGSAGKAEIAYLIRALAGFNVRSFPKRVNKIVAAGPLSSQSTAGNVRIVRAAWNAAFIAEAEEFPEGKNDDQIDAASGAYSAVLSTESVSYDDAYDQYLPEGRI
jgi:predicted phage terminase large subunit-like protein